MSWKAFLLLLIINDLQVLRFNRRSRLSGYNDFLDHLEFQWAGANPIYGIVWGNPFNPVRVPDNTLL